MAADHLFAYGTLLDAACVRRVLGREPPRLRALLDDYARFPVRDRHYPAIAATPGAVVPGSLLLGLTAWDWTLLDTYEGDEYVREPVVVRGGDGRAWHCWAYRWAGATERLSRTRRWASHEACVAIIRR